MTEEEFETIIEHFGDAVEKTVEDAATALDNSLSLAWKFRPVRIIENTLTIVTGAGLIASAIPLGKKRYKKTAKVCLIGGSLVIVAKVVELAVFRKR